MANFGVSIPDELAEILDKAASDWYTNRSQALVRIINEWRKTNRPSQFPRRIIHPNMKTGKYDLHVQYHPIEQPILVKPDIEEE